ncbi:response regulator [Ekhidna sp.]|uniref:LytR/AlgR family response regulator transcription factor n=1 Tax=Ekhidna sp. TaxID=2608089 RepID=UPI0032EEC423
MSRKVKTVIIEDEQSAINRLKKELNKIAEVEFEIMATIESVRDTVSWLRENREVELIFSDIQLTDGLSLEIFKQIEIDAPVIFTTAYDEYALQAFKLNSIDYLLKPIDPAEITEAISKYLARSSAESDNYVKQLSDLVSSFKPSTFRSSFLVSYRHKMMMIDVSEVAYLYVKERGVFLKKKDGQEYVLDFFLDDLDNMNYI